jgi:hypothetical protein
MAETDRDEKLAQAYRALGAEEPPRALDEAILAAARRRPVRWRVPLSLAAVLVLAVGVTLRMLPHRPDAESVALAPQVMEAPRPATPGQKAAADANGARGAGLAPAPEASREVATVRESARRDEAARQERAPAAAAPAAAVAGAAAPEPRALASAKRAAPATPEAWLERIAELKKQGRSREAEESLAEFKKRYPGYKIPEALTR